MPTYSFLTNDFAHPHHRKAIAVLILSVIVFGLLIVFYLYSTDSEIQRSAPPESRDRATTQSALITQLNASAPASMSNEDKKKVLLRMSKSSAGLTNSQKTDIINQLQTP
jgi:hypothetical protein